MAAGIAGARRALANRSISSAPFSIAAALRACPPSSPSVRAFARLPRSRLPFGISRFCNASMTSEKTRNKHPDEDWQGCVVKVNQVLVICNLKTICYAEVDVEEYEMHRVVSVRDAERSNADGYTLDKIPSDGVCFSKEIEVKASYRRWTKCYRMSPNDRTVSVRSGVHPDDAIYVNQSCVLCERMSRGFEYEQPR